LTLVIDASVALKWFIDEDGSDRAAALLDGKELLIAPDLIVAEVCNAGWKAVRAGRRCRNSSRSWRRGCRSCWMSWYAGEPCAGRGRGRLGVGSSGL
jgi:predicted nucleic acid-binding protein